MEDQTTSSPPGARRPLKSRQSRWATVSAAWLARRNVPPNFISLMSTALSALASACFVATIFVHAPAVLVALFLLAIVGMQGRLICNLLDGMVAVEGGKGSKSGEIYNDLPDRISDLLIFVAVGYAIGGALSVAIGWIAAMLAVLTAYVRVLGRSIGSGTYFIGPMAKQQRMAVMTAACAIAAIASGWDWYRQVLLIALVLIVVGSAITVVRRLVWIVRDLESR
jgi:phosphatidylglycerophosphate synthase